MTLKDYFDQKRGVGVLATANAEGKVDTAVYSTPHVFDDGTLAFLMRERLTHLNVQSNPYVSYIFIEEGLKRKGLRLFLEKFKEDQDPNLVAAMTRKYLTPEEDREKGPKFLVYFRVEKILPLIGSGDANITPV
jgi:hypothetical protein